MRLLPALFALCSAFALGGCGSGEKAGGSGSDSLTFTVNGDPVEFSEDAYVWCGPLEPFDKREAVHVIVSPDGRRAPPLWEFHALTAQVKPGTKLSFGGDGPPAGLFFANERTEATSAEYESAEGLLTIDQLDCDGELEFSAEGTLSNERGPDKVTVKGSFRGEVGSEVPPAFEEGA